MEKTSAKEKSLSTLNTRLSKLMREKGISINALAQQAGVAVGTVQKLVSDPQCNPTISSLESIGKILGASISYLIGQTDKLTTLSTFDVPILDLSTLPQDLLSFEAKKEAEISAANFVHCTTEVSDKAYAIKMPDNSMFPLFPENSVLIFDPKKNSYDGAYVLVKIKKYEKVLFKQLLKDEPNFYVKSINPSLKEEIVKLAENDKIIATLVQSFIKYK